MRQFTSTVVSVILWVFILRNGVIMIMRYKSLLEKNPKLASEWHPTKNGERTPKDVAAGSNTKAWWVCQKGHEWEAQINARNRGVGCPDCYGRFREPLIKTHPYLALEWHPTLNNELSPDKVTAGSSRIVYWKCKICEFSYPSTIANRKNGNGCPKCAGKIVTQENSLAAINPNVLVEWHPTKNRRITPHEIHTFSDKKVWWMCKDCKFEWQATPNNRTRSKTGCPKCKEKYNVSFDELAFVYIYKQIFDEVLFNHYIKVGDKSYKVDLYIPKYHLILEYDSEYHHRDRLLIDTEKSMNLIKYNYILVRMREHGLPLIPIKDVVNIAFQNKNRVELQAAILNSIEKVTEIIKVSTYEREKAEQVINNMDIHKNRFNILSLVPPVKKKNNIQENSHYLTNQFDLEMNYPFKPEHFTFGSHFQIWWKCEKGHCWEAAASTRKKGHGCPFCDGQRATLETSLGTINPDMAKEWDYVRNVGITPFDILPNSNKKYWWKCLQGHSFSAAPDHRRRGEGCPYCAGKKVCIDNCLATINPVLASQWHPTKNGELTPYDVTSGSQKKVWWICNKGHEWTAVIYSRNGSKANKPRGCKECYEIGRRKKK